MNNLTLGSLFSGSGGFELAGVMAGIEPKWNSEVEPFAIAVTNKRFPNVKHYGDISKIDGGKIEPVDVITGGFPCQSVSVAGRRVGVKHLEHGDEQTTRSGLFFEATRIIKEMREATNGKYPRYFIVENVLGLFSSNGGEDFRRVLEEIITVKDKTVSVPKPPKGKWANAGEIVGNGYSVAWRVLDAQYHGVPQRRKRIFLIADFDDGSVGKILFESKSLSWNTAKSLCEGQETAGGFGEGFKKASELCLNDQGGQRIDVTENVTATLRSKSNHPPCVMEAEVYENHSRDARYTELGNVAPTVLATYGTGGNNRPFVVEKPKTYDVRLTSDRTKNVRSNVYETEISRTIDTGGNFPDSNQGGVAVVEGTGARPSHQGDGYKESEVIYTLNATEKHAVAYGIDRAAFNQGTNAKYNIAIAKEVEPTIMAKEPGAVAHPTYCTSKSSYHTIAEKELANTLVASDYKDPPMINETEYIVRRLTPTECARLQGFPDWWCDGLEIENPTEEDLKFWRGVFETHRKVVTGASKPKTDKQIIKWLKNPHSDSAEYRLWGNGVPLPCVFYIMNGIADFAKRS